jgi:hypothetical protein
MSSSSVLHWSPWFDFDFLEKILVQIRICFGHDQMSHLLIQREEVAALEFCILLLLFSD